MSKFPREYLQHILDEIEYILKNSEKIGKSEFCESETLTRAFVRSLEIIGEATKNLPDDFRRDHPRIEWRSMAGMRDKLIHGYFGVDYDIVWDVVKNKMPGLQQEIQKIMSARDQLQ